MNADESPTRKRIYEAIQKCPGIHFRELTRQCSVSTGELSHHLLFLRKINLIKEEKHKHNVRFFPLGLNDYERSILSHLRNPPSRHIIMALLTFPSLTHKKITEKMGLSASTISWYLEGLKKEGILLVEKKGREKHYSLNDKMEVSKVLIAHRQSFIDSLVDKFIESWER